MMKFLRYSLLMLLAMVCGTTFAAVETITFSEKGYANNQAVETVEASTFTLAFDKGTNNNVPKYYNTGTALRLYGGNTMTVTAPANITSIKLTFSSGEGTNEITTDPATFSTDTWTGNATKVVFTIGGTTGHRRIASVTVNTEGEATPEVRIAGTTPFIGSTTVTLTTTADNAIINYTTDGTDPRTSATVTGYTAPFTLTETATVWAIALDEATETTVLAEAKKEFQKQDVPTVDNIAAFNALDDNTVATLKLTDAVVLAIGNSNIILKDNTGSLIVYDKNLTATQGQKFTGTLTGTKVLYGGLPEIKDITDNNVTATDGTLTATVTPLADVAGKGYMEDLLKIESVTIAADGNNWALMNGDEKVIAARDQFKLVTLAAGTYDIEGIRGKYNTTEQFWVTKITAPGGGEVTVQYTDKTIAELAAATEKLDNVNLKLNNAQVVYVDGTNAYVREGDKAIMFYANAAELGFTAGKVLTGDIKVNFELYYSIPELKSIENVTNTNDLAITDGGTPVATATTLEDVLAGKNTCDYVEVKGVEITAEGNYLFAVVGETKVQFYNGLAKDDATKALAGNGKKYDVKGLVNRVYSNAYQIQPVEITEAASDGISNVKMTNANADAPLFNLAGQQVTKAYKGVVIQNGRKFINK